MVFRLLQENLRIEYVERSSLFQLSLRTYLSTNNFLALSTTATCSHVLGLAPLCGCVRHKSPPTHPPTHTREPASSHVSQCEEGGSRLVKQTY